MAAKPIPDDYARLSPSLAVDDAAAAIDFYCQVFGATERMRLAGPGDRVGHAELAFGDSVLMLADEAPEVGHLSPKTMGGTPVTLSLYVEDVDDVFRRGLEAGATELRAVADQFYGDRVGMFEDPFGHRWFLATRIEALTPEELERRAQSVMG